MAGVNVTHSQGAASQDSHAQAWKTVMQIAAPANHRCVLRSLSITNNADTAEKPMLYRVVQQAAALTGGQGLTGAVSGTSKTKVDSTNSETPQSTALIGAASGANTGEPTVSGEVWNGSFAQPSGGAQQGVSLPIPGGTYLGIQVYQPESGATAITVTALVEE